MRKMLLGFLVLLLAGSAAAAVSPNDSAPPLVVDPAFSAPHFTSYAVPRLLPAQDDTCGCIDLLLVLDTTGSMSGAINNVKSGMVDIINLASSTCNGDVHAGLITFKDNVTTVDNLTANTAQVIADVNAQFASGGNNEPEASDEALREAFTIPGTLCSKIGDFDPTLWRAGCCKVAVLITDAHPAGCDDAYVNGVDNVNAHNRALDALNIGVKIGAAFVPTFGDPTGEIVPIMVDYAATTGGVYGQTNADGTGTKEAIQQVILDCAGVADVEHCCLGDGRCVDVTIGSCASVYNGHVVNDCMECAVPVLPSTWGRIKTIYH
jgi:uncharacterized protein YegL